MNIITLPRSVVEQALEALDEIAWSNNTRRQSDRADDARIVLRAALEKPQGEQEPVAWIENIGGGVSYNPYHEAARKLPDGVRFDLYTRPQPKRQPLTQEQIEVIEAGIWNLGSMDTIERKSNTQFARAIERAHGIGGDA